MSRLGLRICITLMRIRIPFHFNADPDPTFRFLADPDPYMKVMIFATIGLQTLHGSILRLHACIVSVHGPRWIYFWPQLLLNFDFEVDPNLQSA
jgi:hypothetical protein